MRRHETREKREPGWGWDRYITWWDCYLDCSFSNFDITNADLEWEAKDVWENTTTDASHNQTRYSTLHCLLTGRGQGSRIEQEPVDVIPTISYHSSTMPDCIFD
jgi:hypothetical protein